MTSCRASQDCPKSYMTLLLGDMNRAVGDGKSGIPGNESYVSFVGQLVRELLVGPGHGSVAQIHM